MGLEERGRFTLSLVKCPGPRFEITVSRARRARERPRHGRHDPETGPTRPDLPAMTTADDPPSRPLTAREQTARALGDRVMTAQRPIRVLDAVQWSAHIEAAFLAARGRE